MKKINAEMILGKTILQLQQLMITEKMTAENLTQFYLDRIYTYDKSGPTINSILEVNPDAIVIAHSLDLERKNGKIRSHIHGIPIIVKDNIATADKMRTTNGSYLLMDAKPKEDATIISRLRKAGAIILGKGNMDEMSCCNGIISGRGGGVRNPYKLDYFAGGSSSGPAAAIASDFAVFSIGTDTISSIRFPVSATSLFGLKPTFGLISRSGIIPGDIHIDTVGPITRFAEDAAIVIDILASEDPQDIYTQLKDRPINNCLNAINSKKISEASIGISRAGFFGFNTEVDRIIEENISFLKKKGARIIDHLILEQKPYTGGRKEDQKLLNASRVWALDHYLKNLSADSPIKSINQLAHAAWFSIVPTLLPHFKTRTANGIEQFSVENHSVSNSYVQEAHHRFMSEQREGIITIMDDNGLDFIAFPTTTIIPDKLVLESHQDSHFIENKGKPEIASFSGLPEITIPAGYYSNGLPIGISFLGRPFSEDILLAFAHDFEKETQHRKLPDLNQRIPELKTDFPSIPENNLFEKRLLLENSSGMLNGNLSRAGIEAYEPRFSPRNIDRSVWFTYEANNDGYLKISTQKSHRHIYDMAIYTGTTLKNLQLLEPAQWDFITKNTSITLEVQKNKTYLITLGANYMTVASGYYELEWHFTNTIH